MCVCVYCWYCSVWCDAILLLCWLLYSSEHECLCMSLLNLIWWFCFGADKLYDFMFMASQYALFIWLAVWIALSFHLFVVAVVIIVVYLFCMCVCVSYFFYVCLVAVEWYMCVCMCVCLFTVEQWILLACKICWVFWHACKNLALLTNIIRYLCLTILEHVIFFSFYYKLELARFVPR